ncbi:MAG: TatD family hydrolase [Clostridia bacterium]|nr:TatD family hydrolase [Clostridia bacterium]
MIIDTHAHLTDERFEGEVSQIVDALPLFNIEKVVSVGYDSVSSLGSVEIAKQYERVYATVGIHPHDSKSASVADYKKFEELSKTNSKIVAIGEIGLDYFYDLSPREIQKKVFVEQLELANALSMPVAIHLRDAYEDMRTLLLQNANKLQNGFVLHCYSGSLDMAKVYSKLDGAYFSFGGSLTFKNAKQNAEVLRWLPSDRVLLETDCPYLTPVPFRGKRNEPKFISYVVDKMNEILEVSTETIVVQTKNNTETLFVRIKDKN